MSLLRAISQFGVGLWPRRPRPAILMYHRVSQEMHDPWGLAVDPECFEQQIAYLSQYRAPMSMEELIRRQRDKTLPSNAVAVTFDDGYRDNLINAKPVLVRHGVPATLFLTTGYVDRDTPFWWDEIASMILQSTRPWDSREVCEGETVTLNWGEVERADRDGEWRGWKKPRTARQTSYLAIWSRLRRAAASERDRVINSLRSYFKTTDDPLSKPMNSDEIRILLADGLLTLGGHTVTHSALTCLSKSESFEEICESGRQCKALATKSIDGFAYPYGDMNLAVRRDVANSGFLWACSTESGFVDSEHQEPYALPRIAIPNVPMRTFARLITG